MQLLVEHGASVDALDSNGWNALHHACRSGRTDSAKYLLSISQDPGLVTGDKEKKNALMLAVEDSKVDVVVHLVKDGRLKNNVNAVDANGWTALHRASKVGSKEIVKILLEHGAK